MPKKNSTSFKPGQVVPGRGRPRKPTVQGRAVAQKMRSLSYEIDGPYENREWMAVQLWSAVRTGRIYFSEHDRFVDLSAREWLDMVQWIAHHLDGGLNLTNLSQDLLTQEHDLVEDERWQRESKEEAARWNKFSVDKQFIHQQRTEAIWQAQDKARRGVITEAEMSLQITAAEDEFQTKLKAAVDSFQFEQRLHEEGQQRELLLEQALREAEERLREPADTIADSHPESASTTAAQSASTT